jgi:cytochrome P450
MSNGAGVSFLTQYDALVGEFSDPAQLSVQRRKVMNDWLFDRPKVMLDELRSSRPIFQIPGHDHLPAITFVTKYKDVLEVLDRHQIFSARKYEEKMRPPRGPFVLGMEDSDQYRKELEILKQALPQDASAVAFTATIGQIVDTIFDGMPSKGRLDVIQDVAWLVPLRFNIVYFGLPGQDEATLKRWFRDIYKDLFLNLRGIPQWTADADKAVEEFNAYLTQLFSAGPNKDTVLGRLMQWKTDVGLEGIRRNAFGMTVGVVETCLKAIARTVDQFLRRPAELAAARAAAKQGDTRVVMNYALEAMRFNPQNHVLFRWCEQDCTVAEDTDHAMGVPKNSLVFAAVLSAMFDPEVFTDPERFDQDRAKEKYLFFGHGLHECLGRYIGPVILQAVLMRLLKLENLRRAADDSFNPVDVLPQHLLVDYGSADS